MTTFTGGESPTNTHATYLVFSWIWPILTDLGMQSGISKQQVVGCASLSVSVHQHQLAPNMTIAGKTAYVTWYIKVRVKFQVKAHQSLCKTL